MFWIITGIALVGLIVWLTLPYVGWERLLDGKWPQLVARRR